MIDAAPASQNTMSDQRLAPSQARSQRSPTAAGGASPDRPELQPPSAAGRRVSEAAFWRDYYGQSDICYEWNNGVLEEKPVSSQETFLIYAWLRRLLETFLTSHPIAALTGLDMGFRLPLPTGTVIRRPDMAVVHNANPTSLLLEDNAYQGIYDLCIEVLSDRRQADIDRDSEQKKREYAEGGVPEYYILHADPGLRAFYRRGAASGLYRPIPERDGVIASSILPGFRFRLADLLRRPKDEALLDDPVYADFVLPGWQRDRARAEAERRRAEAMAARLREIGIDPDDLPD
jgi:Uma2 family endonuclease